MDAVLQVLEKLRARTNEKKIPWKTTVDEDVYAAAFGNSSVVITKYSSLILNDRYGFQILDEAGIEIESVSSVQAGNYEEMFRDLFDKARRFARGTDTKLEELLAQLDEV